MCQLGIEDKVGHLLHVRRVLVDDLIVAAGGGVQVKVVGCVDDLFLHGEDISSQFDVSRKGSQEISKGELSLPDWESSFRPLTDILVAVMQENFYKFGR